MQLKYMKNVMPYLDEPAKIAALAWSPNNRKLAVATADRIIVLFDENGDKKDKFPTKPIDSKYGKKSYVIKEIAFSPDSTKLAIGQSDNIIYVYKIGDGWNEKKVICNKFIQQSAVITLVWPSDAGIVFGLAEGKVRLANVKTNKSVTLYGTGTYVISLAVSSDRKKLVSGHANGVIVSCHFDNSVPSKKLCTHTSPPYCLVWTPNSIVAAGCDRRITSYGEDGSALQTFDYSEEEDKEFCSIAQSPSGQSFVVGSFDRLRVFDWNVKRGAWEPGVVKEIQYLYTVANIAWKLDGSRVVIGTLCGGVEMFDCALKKSRLRNNFDATFVGPSQAIIKNKEADLSVNVKSNMGWEIEDVKIMGHDRYVLARTPETIILADMVTGATSEIPWQSAGNEKFYFENENVCFIFNAGELSLVEYGNDEIVGQVRTEFMSPHLISVRINNRVSRNETTSKKLAYLLDLKTICIIDLTRGTSIATLNHDSKVDWLEMNETGRKLLFRDKRSRLNLFDIETEAKSTILSFCTYVQWVPGSDVVVAQNRGNLCIWYNINSPDQATMIPIKGDVFDLVREEGKIEVLVQDGAQELGYALDESLVEFGTAMDDGDFNRAVAFLENKPMTQETEAMWRELASTAIKQNQIYVAERSFAALGDLARVRYLNEIKEIAQTASVELGGDGMQFYKVRARMALMNKQFKDAERIYLEQNRIEEAIEMYQTLLKWDEALELAESRHYPGLDALKAKYVRYLSETGQDERAGELKEKEGDPMAAIDLYLKANMPTRAARVMSQNNLMNNSDLLQTVAVALIKNELYEQAGDLFEKNRDFNRAYECFKQGKAFNRAVELARHAFPEDVVKLEDNWGDHLMAQKQTMQAISHYIEAGQSLKALDAATKARQWSRAVEIVEIVDNPDMAKEYFGKIADHYASEKEFSRAERFYIEAGLPQSAIEMYNKAAKWDEAQRLANEYMQADEGINMSLSHAKSLEEQGRFRDAEKLYIAIQQPSKAIEMYKAAKQFDHLMRVVQTHYPDKAEDMHVQLAKELEEIGSFHEAEKHYVAAKEWKSAVTMFRNAGLWEDAYRLAKSEGGDNAGKQVAFYWAQHLGGDSAVKLLQKYGLLDFAIDAASDQNNFDFAFELCRLSNKAKMPEVHLKYGKLLAEEGRHKEAEQHLIQAGNAKEAVQMYISLQDWDNALRIAEANAPEALEQVSIGQAQSAIATKDFAKAEAFYLRAHQPNLAIKMYKENNMWQDALRIAKDYVPDNYPQLLSEFDNFNLMSGARGAESFVAQAKSWEADGDYVQAAEAYLKICSLVTSDENLMERSWNKAADLAIKFVIPENIHVGNDIVQQSADRLKEIGRFEQAAEYLLQADMNREAIHVLIEGKQWSKAKQVAAQMEPELESVVDEKYKEFLRSGGDADALANVDILSAMDLLINEGKWDKALETARNQNNPPLLEKYSVMYAVELISKENYQKAAEIFVEYGTPATEQNFNMYKKIANAIISTRDTNNEQSYELWASLRGMLLNLCKEAKKNHISMELELFEELLLVSHYYALRSVFLNDASTFANIIMKINISLLRYTDVIPADKAFYEAGISSRAAEGSYESMAFLFLNHYLDLAEAIEEGDPSMVDNGDLAETDIPPDISLPEKLYLNADEHEEIKEWVLAVSVDKNVDRTLLKDSRGVYEASLNNPDGSRAQPCITTGYPVLKNAMPFGSSGKVTNKEDWNKFIMAAKTSNIECFQETLKFVGDWTEHPVGFA